MNLSFWPDNDAYTEFRKRNREKLYSVFKPEKFVFQSQVHDEVTRRRPIGQPRVRATPNGTSRTYSRASRSAGFPRPTSGIGPTPR